MNTGIIIVILLEGYGHYTMRLSKFISHMWAKFYVFAPILDSRHIINTLCKHIIQLVSSLLHIHLKTKEPAYDNDLVQKILPGTPQFRAWVVWEMLQKNVWLYTRWPETIGEAIQSRNGRKGAGFTVTETS